MRAGTQRVRKDIRDNLYDTVQNAVDAVVGWPHPVWEETWSFVREPVQVAVEDQVAAPLLWAIRSEMRAVSPLLWWAVPTR